MTAMPPAPEVKQDEPTPGPWIVKQDSDGYWSIQSEDMNGAGDYVATVWRAANVPLLMASYEIAAERDRLQEINAELLAALDKVAGMNQHSGIGPHCTCSQSDRINTARAAISRATKSS